MENYCKGGLFSLRGELCGEFSPQKIIHPIKPLMVETFILLSCLYLWRIFSTKIIHIKNMLKLPPFAYPFISLVYRKFDSPKIDTHTAPSPRRAHLLFFVGRYILYKINANTHTHTLYLLIMYSVAVKIPRLFADIDVNSRSIFLFEKNFYEKKY